MNWLGRKPKLNWRRERVEFVLTMLGRLGPRGDRMRSIDFRFWHEADVPTVLTNVRYRGQSGSGQDSGRSPFLTHLRHGSFQIGAMQHIKQVNTQAESRK